MSDDFFNDRELTQAQAEALDAASSRPPVNVKTRELPSRKETDAVFLLLYGKLPVIVLCHDAKGWRMFYTEEFKAQKKVRPLVQFPVVDKEYRSSELWPFFAVRIPSISQPEVLRTVQAEKLDYDDVAAMLSRFGRKSVASPFELKPKEEADLSLAGTSECDTQLCDEVEEEVGNERRD